MPRYTMYELGSVLPILITVVTSAAGGYILHAKKWWGKKSPSEKAAFIRKRCDMFSDGKITIDELKDIVTDIYKD